MQLFDSNDDRRTELIWFVVCELSMELQSRSIERWRQQITNFADQVRSVWFRRTNQPVQTELTHTHTHTCTHARTHTFLCI